MFLTTDTIVPTDVFVSCHPPSCLKKRKKGKKWIKYQYYLESPVRQFDGCLTVTRIFLTDIFGNDSNTNDVIDP